MSEERFCELCHEQVWFGAYGTTKDHIDFTTNNVYESRQKICMDCVRRALVLPVIKEEQ